MIAHILGVRNDLNILNLGYTLIQIRKALNVLFSKIIGRGSLLIYAQSNKSLFVDHDAVYTFVNAWLPGLITNYKQVITSIYKNAKALQYFGSIYLTRPQLDALASTRNRAALVPSQIKSKNQYRRFARVPNISLSVLDSSIWLNECECLAIPSIQLCDTQTNLDSVTYPIIANQRSIPFTRLIISLFSETCAYALMTEQLYVTKLKLIRTNLRYLDPINVYAKHIKGILKKSRKETLLQNQQLKQRKKVFLKFIKRRLRKSRKLRLRLFHSIKKFIHKRQHIGKKRLLKFLKLTPRKLRRYRLKHLTRKKCVYRINETEQNNQGFKGYFYKASRIQNKHSRILVKRLIFNRHTYIFNKSFFSYAIRDRFLANKTI
jgi:ribosomal protein S2